MRGFNEAGSTSDTLIQRLQQSDAAAWERFMNIYGSLVYARYVELGIEHSSAEDITSEVVKSMLRSIKRFQPGLFRGYLFSIAKRRLGDWYRKQTQIKDHAVGGDDNIEDRFDALQDSKDWSTSENAVIAREVFDEICQRRHRSVIETQLVTQYLTKQISSDDAGKQLRISANSFQKRVSRLMAEVRLLICESFADDQANDSDSHDNHQR